MTANSCTLQISGNIVDIVNQRIYPGTLVISEGKITDIIPDTENYSNFIIPGLVDAHIHIESSMLVPTEFARVAVTHGTVATVSDPHEIANVQGVAGIVFMLENAAATPLKIYFGVPSCVPATRFETAGANIDAAQVEQLFQKYDLKYLGEMMNFPGVIAQDPEVWNKLKIAQKYNKPIDGHAPGLSGAALRQYVNGGISTEHEAFELEEATEKIEQGMKILIREGSAAHNFAALHTLIETHPDDVMFCSDDRHPDTLVKGHINELVKRALDLGHDKFKILRCAALNPIKHYGLEVGLVQKGDPADFVVINNFHEFKVLETYINGIKVSEKGACLFPGTKVEAANRMDIQMKTPEEFMVPAHGGKTRVIEAIDGQLLTRHLNVMLPKEAAVIHPNVDEDIVKIAVVNRYHDAPPAVGFIKNTGLKTGAIASSVAHDSHNIVVTGVTDEDIARAVNLVIAHHGGLALVDGETTSVLPLPVAGLMSAAAGREVAAQYEALAEQAKRLGSKLKDIFMTLSFMALLVIPELKLSDQGLFDGEKFAFLSLAREDEK